MKSFIVLLLVCLASTAYAAETGPLNDIIVQIQQQVTTVLSNLVAQILAALKPRADLSQIMNLVSGVLPQLLNQSDFVANFISKIKDILANVVAQLINGSKSVIQVKVEAEEKITQQIANLLNGLQNFFETFVQPLIGKRGVEDILSLLGIDLNQLLGNLQQQILPIVNTLIGQILSGKRSTIYDFIFNTFGLGSVAQTLQGLSSNLLGSFTAVASQLLFAGQQIWTQAQPIFTQLVADLTAHASDAAPIVQQAIASLLQVVASSGKRDLVSTAISLLGLGDVWSTVQQLGSQTVLQFTQIATQLLFASQQIWAQAKAILTQLIADLTAHAGDAVPLVAQAIASLNQIISASGKRDLVSTAISLLGLGDVWSTVQQLGSQTVLQFTQIATQLLFASQQIWAQAKAILTQLIADLTAHAGDAVPLVAQAIASLNQIISASGKRDLVSTAISLLGLGDGWSTVQQLGSQTVLQFTQIATQLLFASQQIWAQAKAILTQLIADLTAHAGDAVPLVAQAIASLNQIISASGKRDLVSTAISLLGLGDVWSTVQQLGAQTVLQFTQIATQLLFASQQIWAQAKAILTQLIADLTAHAGDAVPLVAQAIASLNQIISASGKRDLVSTAISLLGLGDVWSTVQQLGSQTVLQFTQIATQLLFASQQIWAQAKAILTQLVADITAHAGDAVPLVAQAFASLNQIISASGKRDLVSTAISLLGLGDVWSTVQQLGSQTVLQFTQIATQLLFASQQIWAQAKAILTQLIADLTAHAGDAVPLVAQAIASLNQIISASGKRDLVSTAISLLGLGDVWSTVQQLGSQTVLQFTQIATQLLFASQQIWAQAKAILTQLVADITAHAGDAVPLVAQAFASLNQIISASGKRDLVSTAISLLGLGDVWSTVQQLGSQTVLQFTQIATQLLFASQQIWAQAKAILTQLIADLTAHAGDAVPLVAQAIASLNQIISAGRK